MELTRGPSSSGEGSTPATVSVVLTGVRSITHLVYASSYLRHLLNTSPHRVHVRVIGSGDRLGHSVDRDEALAALLPSDERLVWRVYHPSDPADWAAGRPAGAQLLCIGAPAVRALARLARSGRRPRVVVVDEGIGSYGSWRTRRAAYWRQGGRDPRSTVRALAVAAAARTLVDVHWSLYRRGASGWSLDERVAEEFRLRLHGVPPAAGTVVYLTQPWSELGVVTEAAYAEHLAAVERASEACGLRLSVRPHPWEERSRYAGLTVGTDGGPAELDRAVVGADAVVGSNSTALLNLAAVHGCRVLRLQVPGLRTVDDELGRGQRQLLDTFLPPALPVASLEVALRDLP